MAGGTHLLARLHPAFAGAAREALERFDDLGLHPIVTETTRTAARQLQLFKQGRSLPGQIVTNAMPGESAHEYGLALDVKSGFGYDSAEQFEMHRLFAEWGFGTVSGDLPHAEHPAFRRWLKGR